MPHTLVEKILLAHVDEDDLRPGDVVTVRCDVVMANDVSGPVAFRAMEKMGAERVFDPSKVVMVADHFMPAKDARSAELQARLKRWSEEQGVTYYGQGRGGIEHAVLCEEGWIVPGAVIAGGDSHTCTYGALGAFGTGLGSTDIASCLALGSFWQAVPETIQIELTGRPGGFVTGKDVILAVIGQIGVGGGTNAVLEFVGPGAEALSVDERLAVANMAVEAGSETGIFPADEAVEAYLDGRARPAWTAERSDADASFRQRLEIDLSALEPLVALPHLPGNVTTVSEAAGVPVDQVYIGNCANGTMTDLRQAASILGGRTVHPRTRAIIVPATQAIWREAADEGLLDLFVEAGAIVSTPTCGACFGGSNGVLAAGENAVATTNRNFRGRMGSPGRRRVPRERLGRRRRRRRRRARPSGGDQVKVEGVALVVPGDNIDTDVMYPGAYLNVEDPEQMAQYLFEGFDPTLRERLVDGTILVVGSNFGIGSSREHVPLAMKGSGIRGVVGRSFARIFYRNCVNLGLAIVACPEAVDAARDGSRIVIDPAGAVEVGDQVFDVPPAPPLVLEVGAAGGLVDWTASQIVTPPNDP